ncbi:unnamed protein product, partial [Oikopleura dioica]
IVVKNYANIELFQIDDENEKDCLGWITILEKCDGNIRTELKNENLDLEERKKIAKGLEDGFDYLFEVGITHNDKKLENFLLLGGIAKILDLLGNRLEEKVTGKWDIVEEEANLDTAMLFVSF